MKIELSGYGWIASILGLCAATQACAIETGPDELDNSEVPESVESAVGIPRFVTSYSWTQNDTGVTKNMVSDTAGFCAMSRIGGSFRSSSDFVGVWQSGGRFTLSGSGRQGAAIRGEARCVLISAFKTNGWAFSGVFDATFTGSSGGAQAIPLTGWRENTSTCWINGFGGNFGPTGEVWVQPVGAPDGEWLMFLLPRGTNQTMRGRASCMAASQPNNLFETTISNSWNQSQGTGSANTSRRLARASTHFCFLTSVEMTGSEIRDEVRIHYSTDDGFYYLTGQWGGGSSRISASASCIAYNQL